MSNSFLSTGTDGVRITRRSARNWLTLVSRDSSTPNSSATTSKDLTGIANKYLSVSSVEDETALKKLSAKREEEAHERALSFVKNQLLKARHDNWLYEPVGRLVGYSPKHGGQ